MPLADKIIESNRNSGTAASDAAQPLWHALSPQEVLAQIGSSPEGLSEAEAARRLEHYGPNVLPRGKMDGPLQLLWRQINNPLIWVLIASGAVAMLVDWSAEGIKNGVVILAVVVLNTLIGFIQEFKAGKAIEALTQMVPENVAVLRGGQKITLPVSQLVPGDIVMLASGDKVPADGRLIACRNLRVEEAALTGESVPVEKQLDPVDPASPLGDRTSMVFGGTLVTYGTGHAVIVETGARTELGKISAMLRETTDLETPLTHALRVIGKYITIGIVVLALLMLILGIGRTVMETGVNVWTAFRETLIFAIALAVGAIPEGLPAIVTIALAVGVQRMAARRAVVRKLPAVETLGSTTVICTDKTGTLTRNEMTVRSLWICGPGGGTVWELTGVGYNPAGHLVRDGRPYEQPPDDIRELLAAAALCNDAALTQENGEWKITGDPTEAALVVAAEKIGLGMDELRRRCPRLDAIPFESENQFMATRHRSWPYLPGDSSTNHAEVILLKGAPEVILKRCRKGTRGTGNAPPSPAGNMPHTAHRPAGGLDAGEDFRALEKIVHDQVEAMAEQGMRVLAVAIKQPSESSENLHMEDVEEGFRLLGLIGMIDPPREEAIAAIAACHAAGITVKMITGDHKLTAAAIGRQLNILTPAGAVTGAQLAAMKDAELTEVAERTNVFARVAPEHKLKLVRALQARGHVVAMTGDGVNDAPALKQANIGVAMGITGTSVSKESAAIVLTDDNFASIAAAVEEGRRVYDNLIKSLAFVLPTNLGLATILLFAVAFFPFDKETKDLLLPMSPVQLLWINLVATVALALPLAFEAREPDVMRRPPRDPSAPVLSRFVIIRTLLVAALMSGAALALFIWEYYRDMLTGHPPEMVIAEAQTMAVTSVILFQILYLLNCRSLRDSILAIGLFSNRIVFIGIGAIVLLQLAFIYLPIMHRVFNSAPLGAGSLLRALAAASVVVPVISIEKWWRRRRQIGRV